MYSTSLLLFVTLLFGLCFAQDCNSNCTNGVEDDIFIASAEYNSWGQAYVRDPTLPPIQAVHSASITTAVIVIHGNSRDAYNYYCYANYAVDLAGVRDSTYVVAPHFLVVGDTLPNPKAFYWVSSSAWKEGGRSHTDTSRISSFQILDEMVAAFYNKAYFPGLTDVLVVGHSAGGQTVQRYAFASGIDKTYKIRYVIENSGSYAYLDTMRPVLPAVNLSIPTCTACVSDEIATAKYEYKLATREQEQACPKYNYWKMGYEDSNVYVKKRTVKTVRDEYKTKNVWYLLGTNDTCNTELGSCGCNDNSLDSGCEALMQGFCRFQRGVIFYQYLQNYYNTSGVHNISYVEGLAHDGCRMLTSIPSLRAMFPLAIIPDTTASTTTTTTTITTATTGESTTSDSTTSSSTGSTTDTLSSTGDLASTTADNVDNFNSACGTVVSSVLLISAILCILL